MSDFTQEPSLQPFQHRDYLPVCLFPCASTHGFICLESPPLPLPPLGPLEVTYLSFILLGSLKSSLPYWRLLVFQWAERLKFSMDVPIFNHLKCKKKNYYYYFSFIFVSWMIITLQYCSGFCHTLTWTSHGFTCVPHPIPLGLPSAPALSTCLVHPTWAGDLYHPR